MPGEKSIPATRTVRLRIAPSVNQGKVAAMVATTAEWDRAVAFYTNLFLDHPGVFDARRTVVLSSGPDACKTKEAAWTDKDRLTWAESVTVATPAHPSIVPERNFAATCPGAPRDLRRAAIHAAAGAVQSYLSNLHRWEKANPKRRSQPPKPPHPHPHLTAYGQMATVRLGDYRAGFVRLKVKVGTRWMWENLPVHAPPYLDNLLAESDRERERITTERAEQNRRMAAEGRTARTEAERRALRPAPGVWVAQSPTLIRKREGWWLHLPFEKRTKIAGKAEDRRLAEPDLKVGTVDLNADSAGAAAWEGARCRGIRTVWHARENAKREKALQKVARRQKRSGRPVKGQRSNGGLWRYIAGLDAAVAWRVAAAIVAWAVAAGLQVLVFEHLRPYRPERGLSWSRRTNRKRAYWLRGKLLKHVRHLAACHGILVVERNPAWTSQACPHCSRLGERFSPDGRGYPSRFRCGHCGWTGDANVVAALNLQRKWGRVFRYPTAEERRAAEASRGRKAGAAASREGSPETVGANVRSTTDAPAA